MKDEICKCEFCGDEMPWGIINSDKIIYVIANMNGVANLFLCEKCFIKEYGLEVWENQTNKKTCEIEIVCPD